MAVEAVRWMLKQVQHDKNKHFSTYQQSLKRLLLLEAIKLINNHGIEIICPIHYRQQINLKDKK